MTKEIDVKRGYDLWSDIYDETPNVVLETEGDMPLEMLGEIEGKRILDAGCGTGRWSIRLADKGAEVYGLDFSEGMISKARKKAGEIGLDIDFRQHDLTERLPFGDLFFDDILCSTVIESIQNIRPLFEEFGRVLRKDGVLVITTIQPLLRKRETPVFEVGNKEYKIPDKVDHFLEDYFHLLRENRFRMEDVREPKEEGTDYPLLLVLKAKKVE